MYGDVVITGVADPEHDYRDPDQEEISISGIIKGEHLSL